MTARSTTDSDPRPDDLPSAVERSFDHRVFLIYNGLVMAVATVIVISNTSEPAALAIGSVMFAMSALLLLLSRIERLTRLTITFLKRQLRMTSALMVAVSCLAIGVVTGLGVASDGLDGLVGKDALAAPGPAGESVKDGSFWEQRMFQAMTDGDRPLFTYACGSLAALKIQPEICAAGATTD
jgi:hypothetical protein